MFSVDSKMAKMIKSIVMLAINMENLKTLKHHIFLKNR